jgi:hypothetical protein
MTGPQLLQKLKESGTGEHHLARVRELVGKKFTVGDVLDALRGFGLDVTANKAVGILDEAGVEPGPKTLKSKPDREPDHPASPADGPSANVVVEQATPVIGPTKTADAKG